MAPGGQADFFAVCMLKAREGAGPRCRLFEQTFVDGIRANGGKIHMWSDKPGDWEVLEGGDHLREPHHLAPAAFDISALILAGFPSDEEAHVWWHSDEVFAMMKDRGAVEKLGIFIVPGLQQAIDLEERSRYSFGDRILIIELMQTHSFKHMQQYVDDLKWFAARGPQAVEEKSISCNLLFAEHCGGVLASEFPLDAAAVSAWKVMSDAREWFDCEFYQGRLVAQRRPYSRCLVLAVPLFREERIDDLLRAKKLDVVSSKLNMLARSARH